MPRFRSYDPEQVYLLPPSVRDVLGEGHLCFFVHSVVERLDLSEFVNAYSEEGHPGYAPELMLKVWLYAYLLGVTSSRRLEQRIVEDLGFRFLAGGAHPDFWALNDFRRRHARALNTVFTQIVEWARENGLGRLGHVAIDSTRIAANASRERMDTVESLRTERARIRRQVRRWQKQCDAEQQQEAPGMELEKAEMRRLEQRLETIPRQLRELRKHGLRQVSRTDPESRFLRERRGFILGYSAEVAVSEDHLVVAQRVTQSSSDNASLAPMVDAVERECGGRPKKVSADSGYFKLEQIERVESGGIQAYVPDANLSYELKGRGRARGIGRNPVHSPVHERMRERLRSDEGRRTYQQRKAIVEPVFGVLKEQRAMRRFRRRGVEAAALEFTLAVIAYNLSRIFTHLRDPMDATTTRTRESSSEPDVSSKKRRCPRVAT